MCRPSVTLQFFIPAALVVGAAIAAVLLWGTPAEQRELDEWKPAVCEVVSANVTMKGSHPGLRINARHTTQDGMVWNGDVDTCFWCSSATRQNCVDLYPVGASFSCTYNPNNPSEMASYPDVARHLLDTISLAAVVTFIVPLLMAAFSRDLATGVIYAVVATCAVLCAPLFAVARAMGISRSSSETEPYSDQGDAVPLIRFSALVWLFRTLTGGEVRLARGPSTQLFPITCFGEGREQGGKSYLQRFHDAREEAAEGLVVEGDVEGGEEGDTPLPVPSDVTRAAVAAIPPSFQPLFGRASDGDEALAGFTEGSLQEERVVWASTPLTWRQAPFLALSGVLHWLVMGALMAGTAYLAYVFGTEDNADYVAWYMSFVPLVAVWLLEGICIVAREHFLERCFVLTTLRVCTLAQLRICSRAIPVTFDAVLLHSVARADIRVLEKTFATWMSVHGGRVRFGRVIRPAALHFLRHFR